MDRMPFSQVQSLTRQEGRAARMLGLPESANPYRKEITRLGDADARLYELAADWDSGYTN